ncbi:GYF domain-containing protein [Prevotella copri]|uniref:GYF domain-containing protein n=1 Tax=Segatella copri TaxID=165179 RepID=A0AAW5IHW5_9BACT|nr:SPFH domain-containing protein [Segatella copri]MCP9537278.1 GYF domain-containing protein [Segatella copri]MCP9540201.1 GYF domain-containing protein [Segatella copri]MCP9558505.1 GYF domain-containing protein [Segatella copri]MCP9561310.1 GYF domain-containing protein [Segatella copri]MCP9564064.1 GYF domain-containing protein [Segatella copri]
MGFKSSKEVEEEKRQAAEEAARRVEQNNLTNLSNLSKGSQLNFAIPYFDVFDPRLQDYGVPVSVHGAVVYAIEDMDLFHSVNRNEGYSDETFKNKLRGQLTKFIKSVVSNAPSDAQIPVVQIERKIFEISELIQQRVTPQVEKLFGITIRSLDITGINVDKESRGYRELKALTADLEKERMMAQHNAQISNFNLNNDLQQDMLKKQSELNLDAMGRKQELDLGGQEELQRMNLENQRETMRIQREEMQRASRLQTEQTFMGAHQANLNAGVLNNATDNGINAFRQQSMGGINNMGQMGGAPQMPGQKGMGDAPQMPGMGAAVPQVQYYIGINGQQYGPCDWNKLQQLVQQGQLTQQSYVWKNGMAQWEFAGNVAELAPLFQGTAPQMPGMPPTMPGM